MSEQTRARKASGEAHDLQVAMDAVAWLPSLARRALARMSARPESFHAVVSNVPGPDQPLFLLGRRLRAAHPAVPLAEGHAVSIGVLSYHGRLHVGVYADRAAIPDADDLARGVAASFDALRLAGAEPPDRPPRPGAGAPASAAWPSGPAVVPELRRSSSAPTSVPAVSGWRRERLAWMR